MNGLRECIQSYTALVLNKWTSLANTGVVMIDDPDVPASFMTGDPIANLAVAETAANVTTLRGLTTINRFIDIRDNTLHERDGGGWSTRTYTGEEAFLRPKTLCFSTWNGRFYYVGRDMVLHRINTGTAPTI